MTIPHYVRIAPNEPLPDLIALAPFKAVVVLETDYSSDWQNEVSDWLIKCGCRYMMAWGPNCSSWDDSVDWADLDARDFEDDDDKFVMTTWHENESLEDVFWFSQSCANMSSDDVELILHVSSQTREDELLSLFEQSKSLANREDGSS